MSHLPERGKLLRIYLAETDRHETGAPLYQWIVEAAQAEGLAGATVLRGMEGFGAHSRLRTGKVMRLSLDLPIVVEIVDVDDRIDGFLNTIDTAIPEGLATVEPVNIIFYRSRDDARK